jgi:NTE family protein
MKQQPSPMETVDTSKAPAVVAETRNASRVERALVLSGGGPVGRAWMAGLVAGLLDNDVDLGRAELIVGTSAGSIVGAELALGMDVAALVAESNRQSEPNIYSSAGTELGNLLVEFANAACAENPDEARAAIGRKALAAATIGEDAFVARSVYSVLAGREWPPTFRATAVSTTTGRLAVWSKDSHVDLARAVASSSSVPGVSPPVTLNGDRYMDGGVSSSLNADLAAGARFVIVVSCFSLTPPDGVDANLRHLYEDLSQELDAITAAGGSLEIIEPGPEFLRLSGYGSRLMDTNLVPEAVQTGRRQAMIESARLGSWMQLP